MTFQDFTGSNSFQFVANVNLRFGGGTAQTLASELTALGVSKPFVMVDPGVYEGGVAAPILKALEAAGIAARIFTEIEPNPSDVTIERAFATAKKSDCDSVVGIGGGSAMDSAKGVGLLMTNGGAVAGYDGTNKVKHDLPPVVAIPTTAGTGSEVTANASVTRASDHYKMSLRSPRLLPKLAIVDPLLLRTLPRAAAAASGLDALTHAVEGYLSVRASPLSDFFALRAMELLAPNVRSFVANPENLEAASSMALGSMLAGLVVSNTGTGNDHALARALGGLCEMPHGVATAMLLPHVMTFNAAARPDRYVDIARAVGVSTQGSPREVAARVIDEVRQLLVDLDLPTRLRDIGVPEQRLPEVVDVAIKNVGPNPRRTSPQDLAAILSAVY
jgi:alcohol dehydrogenase class IV